MQSKETDQIYDECILRFTSSCSQSAGTEQMFMVDMHPKKTFSLVSLERLKVWSDFKKN